MCNKMLGSWISMEHYRLHCIEDWADSPRKWATLAAIHSSLERLASSVALLETTCMVCTTRRNESVVLKLPSRPQSSPTITRLAA